MAVITLPSNLKLGDGCGMGQRRYDLLATSDATGDQQARLLGPPRWTLQLVQPGALTVADADTWRALLVRLRGRVNHLAAWDPGRPRPRGSLGGTVTLSGSAAIGATTLALTGATARGNLLSWPQDLRTTAEAGSTRPWSQVNNVDTDVVLQSIPLPLAGTGNASRLQCTTTGSATRQTSQLFLAAASSVVTCSIYARADQVQHLSLILSTRDLVYPQARFNLSTGAVTATLTGPPSALIAASAESVGGGWWRCSITGNVNTGANDPAFTASLRDAAGNPYSGSIGDGLHLWGAQAELNGAATPYPGLPTLKAGDLLQVGTGLGTSQLVMVAEDLNLAEGGTGTVTIEPPLRRAFDAGAAVTWDRPVAYFRQSTETSTWTYGAGGAVLGGMSLDLLESWS